MNYLKNYSKEIIKICKNAGVKGLEEVPKEWENDMVKLLGDSEYPIPKDFKKIIDKQ